MDNTLSFGICDALTPLDGRNRRKILPLAEIFSELNLDKYRILVEIRYFQKLSLINIIRKLSIKENNYLNSLIKNLNKDDYQKIREIEKTTNHDLKAVEEFIKKNLRQTSLQDVAEMIHFGLTSDDTNNIAYSLLLKESLIKVLIPELDKILQSLKEKSFEYKNTPLLGKTHGQPAVPTTIGKELVIYYQRLKEELLILKSYKIKAKLTGNVGNLNVHQFIYPKINWLKISEDFIKSLSLKPDIATTQIEPYDSFIRIFQSLIRINNILTGMCLDFWLYISQNYFLQKNIKGEVGSTALPHKINPIYFEGAEGGFGIANALLEFYCRKLSSSRLQRDLSDSTIRRSFGIVLGYCLLSYQSVFDALERIDPDKKRIDNDLENNYQVLSEAIQNYLRTKGLKDAYDQTKAFFRGRQINKTEYQKFVKLLKLPGKDKQKLINLTPQTYTGYAKEIVSKLL